MKKKRYFGPQLKVLIDAIQAKFPKAFPSKPEPKVPLAIGITKDLLPYAEEFGVKPYYLKLAMYYWCQGRRYWKACSDPNAQRVDLFGNPVGQIQENHAMFALAKLTHTKEAKLKKAA